MLVSGPSTSAAVPGVTRHEVVESGAALKGDAPVSHKLFPTRWLSHAYVIAFVAGVGFFAFSFLVLAIIPGRELEVEIKRVAPVTMPELTSAEQRGRVIFGREGCAYCHTQQIRSVAQDVRRFGSPPDAVVTKDDYPHLFGIRR